MKGKQVRQYKILLVDDSQSTLNALKRVFKSEDYEVFTALSARDALSMLQNIDIDVLITDEGMPEATGSDLLLTINSQFKDLIKIMLTGTTDIDVIKSAINSGHIYKFFNKPWDDNELLMSIKQALQKKELERENKQQNDTSKKQEKPLQKLKKQHPGIAERNVDSNGCIIINE